LSDPISLAYDKRGFLSGAKTDRRELAYESDMGLLAEVKAIQPPKLSAAAKTARYSH